MGRTMLSLDLLGVPVVVEVCDKAVGDRVDALLCDLPRSTAVPRHRLRLEAGAGSGQDLDLYDGGRLLQAGMEPADAITVILWHLNQLALTTEGYAVIHAGCVSHQGAGAVLCAPTGAGKSTLVTALVEHGFDYLSDEFAAVSLQDGHLCPSHTPIGLKKGSFALFPHLRPPPWELGDADSWHVPSSRLRPGCRSGRVRPAAVVMPQYEALASCRLEPVDAADALRAVLDQTLNLSLLGGPAFRAVARLVATVSTHRLIYSDLDEAAAEVGDVLAGSLVPQGGGTPDPARPRLQC